MVKVVRLPQIGGAEQFEVVEAALTPPGRGEVLIRQVAAGVNFVDVYHRTGLYPLPLPAVLGVEGSGVVEEVGPGVEGLMAGDRVAWAAGGTGGYAERRLISAERLLPLPPGLPFEVAGCALLRGLTAHMLVRRVAPPRPGQTILIHAVAGGLGLVVARWVTELGATVIGTVGSAEKAALAAACGVPHVVPPGGDFVAVAREVTGGQGVDVVIDGVGGETSRRSLDALRPFGVLVSLGQACGAPPSVDPVELGPRRSLSLSRPSVFAYCSDPAVYRPAAAEVLDRLAADPQGVVIGARFPLEAAAEAHRALEGRRTSGAVLLVT